MNNSRNIVIIITFLSLSLQMSLAKGSMQQNFKHYKELINKGQYAEAMKSAKKMDIYPAFVIYGRLIEAGQYHQEIEKIAGQWMEKKPSWGSMLLKKFIKAGRPEKAEKTAMLWMKNDPFVSSEIFEELIKAGRYKKPIKAAKLWIQNDPRRAANIYVQLAKEGQYKEAKKAARQLAKKHDPYYAVGIYLEFIKKGQYTEAIAEIKQWINEKEILHQVLKIVEALAKKGQVPKVSIIAVQKGIDSSNSYHKKMAEEVKKILIKLKKWPVK